MLKYAMALGVLAFPGWISKADAAVVYSFSTVEPFAGGVLGFSYEAPDFLVESGFIERSALTSVVGDVQRVRFEANCPFGGGASNCDQLTIFAGSVSAIRYFSDGAFRRPGASGATFGSPATLQVALRAVAAVPEPATWAMLLIGFGGLGFAMRRKERVTTKVAFA